MTTNWAEDIRNMHQHFGHTSALAEIRDPEQLRSFMKFRIDFLIEELEELALAFEEDDFDGEVDALIDLIVVAIGTLDGFGVDANKAWDVVHAANMAKQAGTNDKRPNAYGLPDLTKPEGWKPPSHEGNFGRLPETKVE